MGIIRRAGAQILKLIEQALDPAAEANRILLYSKDVAGASQLFARASDGTVSQLTPPSGGGGGGDATWYGTGVDGDLVVASGTVTTLDTNRSYNNVTVQTNAMLYGQGWKLCVAGTLTIEGTGTVEASGGNGINNGSGPGGNQNANPLTTKSGYTKPGGTAPGANGLRGRAGGAGGVGAGTNGTNESSVGALRTMNGGNGGNGGTGSAPGGTGGVHQGDAACFSNPYVAQGRMEETEFEDWVNGGASGAGGGGGNAGAGGPLGGGGGGGGGVFRLSAKTIVCPDGAIKATGGNGGNAVVGTGGDAGGGGGGQGGVVLLITDGPFDPTVKCDVTGGNGGAGVGAGTSGTAGTAGFVVAISPSSGPLP